MNPELIAMIIRYTIMGTELGIKLLQGASELKAELLKAREAGHVTDEQWAQLEAKLGKSEEARRKKVAAYVNG